MHRCPAAERPVRPGPPPLPLCPPQCYVYDGTWDVARKVVRREGLRALCRGTGVSLLMAVPSVGMFLRAYEALLERLKMTPLSPETL